MIIMEHTHVLHFPDNQPFPFTLSFCGRSSCYPSHSCGPSTRQQYILHFITKGKGIFSIHDQIYTLHASQGFLIPPDTVTYYQADVEDPWEYFWIGIVDSSPDPFLSSLGICQNTPVFHCQNTGQLSSLLSQMLSVTETSPISSLTLQGLLCLFLAEFSSQCISSPLPVTKDKSRHIQDAIFFIQKKYHLPITVQDIADHLSLDRSYLSSLFQKHLRQTIQSYLTNCRLQKAEDLLILTNQPVKQIALSCGYLDIATFSKAFKRKNQIAPSLFRIKERELYQKEKEITL